ncbi:MAG: hypothetical protein AAFX40_16310 [Cyanobacteria bacterium J06639_1]
MQPLDGRFAIARSVWQSLGVATLTLGVAACGADVASESTPSADSAIASADAVDVETVAVNSGGVTRNQVVVNGTPVASFSETQGKRARVVAKRLEKLAGDRKLAAHLAQPSLANGMAVGAIADEVVFTVDEATAQWYDEQPSELTVKWVNNLRIALGGDPLGASEIGEYRDSFPPQELDLQGFSTWYGASFYGSDGSDRARPASTYMSVNSPEKEETVLVRTSDRGPHVGARVLDVSSQSIDIVSSNPDAAAR